MIKHIFTFLVISIFFVSCESETKNIENATEAPSTIEMLKTKLEKDSNDVETYYALASALNNEELYKEALEYLKEYEAKDGDENKLCFLTASIYENKLYDPKNAIPYYERLAKVSDDSCTWYNHAAMLSYYNLTLEETKSYFDILLNTNCELVEENEAFLKAIKLNYSDFNNDEYKVSFKYPVNWKTSEQVMPNMYFYEAVDKASGINFNITVGSDQNATLSDWKNMISNELEKEGVEILSSMTTTVNNQTCNFSSVKRGNGNNFIIQNNYVLLKNGYAYMMNFTCSETLYEEDQYIGFAIIRSVRID